MLFAEAIPVEQQWYYLTLSCFPKSISRKVNVIARLCLLRGRSHYATENLFHISIIIIIIIFTQPLRSDRKMTQSQFFKRSLIGLNSEFSFS